MPNCGAWPNGSRPANVLFNPADPDGEFFLGKFALETIEI
jgi:hypothetical protein